MVSVLVYMYPFLAQISELLDREMGWIASLCTGILFGSGKWTN